MEKHSLNLRCPHCFEDTNLEVTEIATCKHCEKSLIETKFIKPVVSAGVAFIVALTAGLGGGKVLDDYFEKSRYPIEVEYSVIERSLTSDDAPIARSLYGLKKNVIIRALEETQKEIDYEEYKENRVAFFSEFKRQIKIATEDL